MPAPPSPELVAQAFSPAQVSAVRMEVSAEDNIWLRLGVFLRASAPSRQERLVLSSHLTRAAMRSPDRRASRHVLGPCIGDSPKSGVERRRGRTSTDRWAKLPQAAC